jgi:hypothetical protein
MRGVKESSLLDAHPIASIDRAAAEAAPRDVDSTRRSLRIVIISVAIGLVLRAVQYLHHTSYWNDEAALVMNILHRGFGDLLRPLDFAQAAPPFFLWVERLIYRAAGSSEFVLRAPPVLMGFIALPCFALLAWRLLRPSAATWAVAWYAVNDRIIPQVTEVKQYSGDLLFSTLILLAAFGSRRHTTAARRLALISLVACVGIWFSFTTSIVFAGVALAMLPQVLRRRRGFIAALACIIPVLLSGALLAHVIIAHPHDPYLDEFWADHFADLRHPATWLAGAFFELGDYPFASFGVLVLFLAGVGAWALKRQGNATFVSAVVLTLTLAVAMSAARLYPFGGLRITLYLLPMLFLLMGAGARPWGDGSTRWYARAWWILPAPLLITAATQCANHTVRPVARSNIRPVAQYVLEHRKPTQAIFLAGGGVLPQTRVSGRNIEFLCYWPGGEQNIFRTMIDPRQIKADEFWVVYTTISTDKRAPLDLLLQDLQTVAQPIQEFSTGPAGAVLYRLRKMPSTRPAPAAAPQVR